MWPRGAALRMRAHDLITISRPNWLMSFQLRASRRDLRNSASGLRKRALDERRQGISVTDGVLKQLSFHQKADFLILSLINGTSLDQTSF